MAHHNDSGYSSLFLEKQMAGFHRLVGAHITQWQGVEMALREKGADGHPQFFDPAVPYLQFLTLSPILATGESVQIDCCQNDDIWGLMISEPSELSGGEENFTGIFRLRSVPEIPCGRVSAVDIVPYAFGDGDIERVIFRMGKYAVSLIAGEVYEEWDGSLRVQLGGDESVLVLVESDS